MSIPFNWYLWNIFGKVYYGQLCRMWKACMIILFSLKHLGWDLYYSKMSCLRTYNISLCFSWTIINFEGTYNLTTYNINLKHYSTSLLLSSKLRWLTIPKKDSTTNLTIMSLQCNSIFIIKNYSSMYFLSNICVSLSLKVGIWLLSDF